MSAGHVCGTCNLCCKVMEIRELSKPEGVWCAHCAPGRGCGIYADRPTPCREFSCQWLVTPELPDSFRPDRTKVVLTMAADGATLLALCEPANPMAWKKEPIYGLLKDRARQLQGSDFPVFARCGPRLWWVAPDKDVDLGLSGPDGAHQVEIDGVEVTIRMSD
ncbi:MAG: hypothetical protein JWM33_1630 [Caulobacteraceae bacterium]|nr:hypothetical protein [Caulobacteraceae bacterium]